MSHLRSYRRAVITALCGVGLAAIIGAPSARADEWDKKTILTVNQPIQVKEDLLPPGTYVFKLLNSPSNRHVVQIFNSDQSHLIDTVLAIPNYRLQPTGDTKFAFWETPAGNAKALRAWFYPGDNYGQEFPYPKHFISLHASASVGAPSVSTYETTPVMPPAEAQPMQQSEQESITQEEMEPQPSETEPQEMAQATPPPAPQTNTAPSTPPEQTTPSRLPTTGTLYPLIGLVGLISLGIYGLLRLARHA